MTPETQILLNKISANVREIFNEYVFDNSECVLVEEYHPSLITIDFIVTNRGAILNDKKSL